MDELAAMTTINAPKILKQSCDSGPCIKRRQCRSRLRSSCVRHFGTNDCMALKIRV
jgi:hypothetical protein